MAYQIYTTNALVCGSRNHNTADRHYLLFTRELGMLWATARSVREERSKQRFALQDFSLVRVSLVRGKTGWRVGSTEAVTNPFLAADSRAARSGVVYLIKQLRRYINGEQPLPSVFDDLTETLTALTTLTDVLAVTIWQNTLMARLLYALGYVSASQSLQAILTCPSTTEAVLGYQSAHEGEIDDLILRAEQVSHL